MRTFYDDIVAGNVPATGDGYMGYDDGSWPDAAAMAARFPGKPVWRVTVNPNDLFGDWLDVETGDAQPWQAPGWIARRRAAGHPNPGIYCSASPWADVKAQFVAQGVPEPIYWVAKYDNDPSIPASWIAAGCVAKQYQTTRDWDANSVIDHIPGLDSTTQEHAMGAFNLIAIKLDPKRPADHLGRLPYWGIDAKGETFAFNGARALPSPIKPGTHTDIVGWEYIASPEQLIAICDDGHAEPGEPGGYGASTFALRPQG